MRNCCIDGCEVANKNNVTLFEFPTSRLLRKRWLDAINPASKLAVDALVCSLHFSEHDYEDVRGKVRLKSKVVPTLFGEVNKPSNDPLSIPDNEETKKTSETSKNDNHNGNVDSHNENVDTNNKLESKDTENAHEDNVDQNNGNVDKDCNNTDNKNVDDKKDVENNKDVDNNTNVGNNKDDDNKNVDYNKDVGNNKDDDNKDVDNKKDVGNDKDVDINTNVGNGNVENTNVVHKPNKKVKKKWVPMRKIAARRNGHLDSDSSQDSVNSDAPPPPILEDLEEHLPNYQIANMKTERQVAAMTETLDPVEDVPMEQDIEEIVMEPHIPVFIELSVGQDNNTPSTEEQPNDCLMVLESVQCDIDPTLMLQARAEEEACCEHIDLDDDDDDDVLAVETTDPVTPVKSPRKTKLPADPISLLTSSDEDDVILQEPHIDTLSVSDETDEDDLPLQKLIKKKKKEAKGKKKKKKTKPEPIKSVLCGVTDFYCTYCQHLSPNNSSHQKHIRTHKAEEETSTTTIYQICKECGFTTSSKSQLYRHQRKHLNEKKYKCPLCTYRSKYNMSLMYHLKTHDFDPNLYNCGACGLELDSKKALLEHQKTCSAMGDKFVCSLCGYATNDKRALKIHKNSVHKHNNAPSTEEQPNDCLMVLESVQCDIDPTLMLQARAEEEACCEHIDLDDDDDDDVLAVETTDPVTPVKSPRKTKLPADPISLLTSSDEDDVILQEPHIDTLSVSDETDEDDLPLQKLIKKKKKEAKGKKKKKKTKPEPIKSVLCGVTDFYCTYCQHLSPNNSSHQKHIRTHKAEEETSTTTIYQICKECGFTTSSKSQLYRHQRKHLNEKKYKCPLCTYRSKYNMSLMYHLKTHDFDPNLYNCGACGLELDSKKALLEHQKTCSAMGDKFVCSLCGYATNDKRALKIHKNSVHKRKS